jgi:hypothetical protein
VLAIPDERLDDLQCCAGFAFGATALEVRGQLAIGAQDLLFAKLLRIDAVAGGSSLHVRASILSLSGCRADQGVYRDERSPKQSVDILEDTEGMNRAPRRVSKIDVKTAESRGSDRADADEHVRALLGTSRFRAHDADVTSGCLGAPMRHGASSDTPDESGGDD